MAEQPTTAMQCLGPSGIFGGLDAAEQQMVTRRARRRYFTAGELLFQEGDHCTGLHIVAAGRVRIFKSAPNGREQVLAIEGPGSTVAELPVFDGGNYPASAIAVEATEIMFLPREEFRAFCLERPEVALKVLAAVGARLRKLVDLIEELSSPPSASASPRSLCGWQKPVEAKPRKAWPSISRTATRRWPTRWARSAS